jgi:hypothetical protein
MGVGGGRQDGGGGGGAGRGRKREEGYWNKFRKMSSINSSPQHLTFITGERAKNKTKNELKSKICLYRPITVTYSETFKSRKSEEFYSVNKSVFCRIWCQ